MTSTTEAKFEEMVTAHDLPAFVLVASNAAGTFTYQKAFGQLSHEEGSPPMPLDATFDLASMTKLVTTICALQLVEQGLINLDDPVGQVLPECASPSIITGFDSTNNPILIPAKNKITLRHLLTHTSGFTYAATHPLLIQFRTQRGEDMSLHGLPLLEQLNTPLIFEPGTSWAYGTGIDWAGVLVERLSGCSLSEYMEKNIFEALGITDLAFHLGDKPEMAKRRAGMNYRDGEIDFMGMSVDKDGKIVNGSEKPNTMNFEAPRGENWGGNGLLGSVTSYLKIPLSLISTSISSNNTTKLLKQSTINEMFTPQLSPESRTAFQELMNTPLGQRFCCGPGIGLKMDWGLGGMMVLEETKTGRKEGSIAWAGMPNLVWWVDRVSGVVGVSGTRLFPFGDPKMQEAHFAFEREMYERLGKGTW